MLPPDTCLVPFDVAVRREADVIVAMRSNTVVSPRG